MHWYVYAFNDRTLHGYTKTTKYYNNTTILFRWILVALLPSTIPYNIVYELLNHVLFHILPYTGVNYVFVLYRTSTHHKFNKHLEQSIAWSMLLRIATHTNYDEHNFYNNIDRATKNRFGIYIKIKSFQRFLIENGISINMYIKCIVHRTTFSRFRSIFNVKCSHLLFISFFIVTYSIIVFHNRSYCWRK